MNQLHPRVVSLLSDELVIEIGADFMRCKPHTLDAQIDIIFYLNITSI